MPKLWAKDVETHHRQVRETILDAAERLVARRGLGALNMSAIAAASGIGRATLYKYFADLDGLALAWHERQVERHLSELATLRSAEGSPLRRLATLLETYAANTRGGHGSELAALLHRGAHVDRAEHRLSGLVETLLADAVRAREVRRDVPLAELASFCLHAVAAVPGRSRPAIRRLVTLTLDGVRR
jgi:AcrR family transcriptional regulator